MKKSKWLIIEDLAKEFQYADQSRCDEISYYILDNLKAYIKTCANNAYKSSCLHNTYIPKEDFESNMTLAVWAALKDFDVERGRFQGILTRKIRFAEISTWRQYKTISSQEGNQKSYLKAQWDSLDRPVSKNNEETMLNTIVDIQSDFEDRFIEDRSVIEIIRAFEKKNRNYGEIIAYIYQGYEGASLAYKLGEKSYNPRIRKSVQRAKESFRVFLNHNSTKLVA